MAGGCISRGFKYGWQLRGGVGEFVDTSMTPDLMLHSGLNLCSRLQMRVLTGIAARISIALLL